MNGAVAIVVVLLVAPLGSALTWAVAHAEHPPREGAAPAAAKPGQAGYLCESCRRHPAVRVVVADGESFMVCQGCVVPGVRS